MAIDKRNILLIDTETSHEFAGKKLLVEKRFPKRDDVSAHAKFIERKITECYERSEKQKQAAAIKYKEGIYLEFSSASNYDMATKSLEDKKQGIRLLNIKEDKESNTIKATVYIPDGKQAVFLKKVEDYADINKVSKSGNPKNNDLISSIDDIKIAVVESFWFGKLSDMPNMIPLWCEIWLRYENDNDYESIHSAFDACCKNLQIETDDKKIKFPERTVRLIKATKQNLIDLISSCEYISELRRSPEPTSFFVNLSGQDQKEIINSILTKVSFNNTNSVICILDTGLASEHPLIKPTIANIDTIQAYKSSWGEQDHDGHGTEMAGIAIYRNLTEAFLSDHPIAINHNIESVKILPPKGKNRFENYGAITEQSVSLAEIANPKANRVLCMAVTSTEFNKNDGSPTSWSAAIDNITSGANEEDINKRLFFVSAGNVSPFELSKTEYPDSNIIHSVENPGQSWNAITVGCYSDNILINDNSLTGFFPVADVGELSPYSSTSVLWDSKWPIKPEILLDGGNMATNGIDYTEAEDLELLTTSKDFLTHPLSTIWATSSATAQASWIAAEIYAEYPQIWPETVRALIIHSARWTDKMKSQFCKDDSKTKGRHMLLHTCGYGIPNLDKAIQCYNNSVNLVIESELQPYSGKTMNEMHMHKIPWPKDVLLSLKDKPATLRITLSYFIEPGPGEIGWQDKYRYASCSLRFDVINSNETIEDFHKRINIKMRGDDKKDKGDGSSRNWFLGTKNRDVGSIHSDFCETTAADLADANYVAVYPLIGWWRERNYLGKSNNKIRYSLIISIETPETSTDLYTPIITQIENKNIIKITT